MYTEPQDSSEDQMPGADRPLGGSMGGATWPASQRARFERCFAAQLQRLGREDEPLDPWQEENLLSALGAATFGEYELACGLVETAALPPDNRKRAGGRDLRRAPLSVGALRRRFQRLR